MLSIEDKRERYSTVREDHHVGYICMTCNSKGAGPFGFDEQTKGGRIMEFHTSLNHELLYLDEEQFVNEYRDDE